MEGSRTKSFERPGASSTRARWWRGIALGQVCAFANASSALASTALERRRVYLPAWQTFFAYVAIGLVYAPMYVERLRAAGRGAYSWSKAKKYCALALIDAEANYLMTLSFRFTSMTSVSLLDNAAIPFAMGMSWIALRARYAEAHVVGAVVALGGISFLILSDAASKGASTAVKANAPLGDFLCVTAAAMYATSNVLAESFLKDSDRIEVLAHLGVLGAGISGAQSAIIEGMNSKELAILGPAGVGLFAAYAAALFFMYTFSMDVLERCGASAFNVSMLASDVWAVIFRLIFFSGFASGAHAMFFGISFALVAIGIAVFASAGDPGGQGFEYGVNLESTADDTPAWITAVRNFVRSGPTEVPYVVMDANYDLEPVELGSLGR